MLRCCSLKNPRLNIRQEAMNGTSALEAEYSLDDLVMNSKYSVESTQIYNLVQDSLTFFFFFFFLFCFVLHLHLTCK